jgi:DNA-binding NtrC family response regulator
MTKRPYPSLPLLLVDDEKPWLRGLSLSLKDLEGIDNVIKCSDSREVMGILARQRVSLVLLDLTMPHVSGRELLTMIAGDYPEVPVIILTGMNQVETAVSCMRAGAFDFFVKTVEEERLASVVRRALSRRGLEEENRNLSERVLEGRLENPSAFAQIVTESPRMLAIFQYLEAIATSREPILITGESGVGKELIAKVVHTLCCPEEPWVAINAAGLDDNVFADTLFGHTAGAFTGADQARPGVIEEAGEGVLFLDEIGDLSVTSQLKLLRFLQEGEYFPVGSDKPRRVHARVIVATNQDLKAKGEAKEFRRDLYYRLASHRVRIPPLRERTEDIPPLLNFFLQQVAPSLGKKVPAVPPELPVLLSTHPFPGNVRELRAMVFDAVSIHRKGTLSMDSFKSAINRPDKAGDEFEEGAAPSTSPTSLEAFPGRLPTLEEAGVNLVKEAMKRCQGNQTMAANMLGISRQALGKRLKKHGL